MKLIISSGVNTNTKGQRSPNHEDNITKEMDKSWAKRKENKP